jgi:predicted enzyme related to lactoylglutathione lyase
MSGTAMIVNFEIPADDLERAMRFYSELFGWEIREVTGRKDYFTITSTGKNSVGGGLIKRFLPQQTIINYIDVPSIDECSSRVAALGGRVIVRKKPVRGAGYFAVCRDTEDNPFGIWEANTDAA